MTLFGGKNKRSGNCTIDINNMSDSGGTMFNVTAKNCKDWADTVNKNKFSVLLTEIAERARAGKYMVRVRNLSKEFEKKLTDRNFIVTKSKVIGYDPHDIYFIIWK